MSEMLEHLLRNRVSKDEWRQSKNKTRKDLAFDWREAVVHFVSYTV